MLSTIAPPPAIAIVTDPNTTLLLRSRQVVVGGAQNIFCPSLIPTLTINSGPDSINIRYLSIQKQKCFRLQIETYKVNWSAESKLNTRENLRYKESQATSPTRSAAVRRQRSRSSHGARDQAVAKAAAKGDAKAEWNQRQTVSAAPAHRTQPVV